MSIAPRVDQPVATRLRVELADAMEHYLAISRSAGLFASAEYYDHAEAMAWGRMIDAVAMAEMPGVWGRGTTDPAPARHSRP